MIEILWLNESNFKMDFTKDSDLVGQSEVITQQLFAFVMGWA